MKIGILVSGRGSNLKALIDAMEAGKIKVEIAVVISNRAEAPALERAKKAKIQTEILLPQKGENSEAYDQKLARLLQNHQVDLVVLAGFMRILSPDFIKTFKNRIINIHPSLLPAFPGLIPQKQALRYGVRYSGCTVHFVDEGCDTGPVIMQRVVPVLPDDTLETLSDRILHEEHKLLPKVIDLISQNKVKVVGRKVEII